MSETCSICGYDPYAFDASEELMDVDYSTSLCPDCAKKYGFHLCTVCGQAYPLWSGQLGKTEKGRCVCKYCAKPLGIKIKIIQRDKSKYPLLPNVSPKLYPFIILDIIKNYYQGVTKKEIEVQLNCRIHKGNFEHAYQNGVDHKTVTANLNILMDEDNPFHEHIVVKDDEYYYK